MQSISLIFMLLTIVKRKCKQRRFLQARRHIECNVLKSRFFHGKHVLYPGMLFRVRRGGIAFRHTGHLVHVFEVASLFFQPPQILRSKRLPFPAFFSNNLNHSILHIGSHTGFIAADVEIGAVFEAVKNEF